MKKKLALGTTALAVLASVVPSHVAPVEASTEGTMPIVYTSFDSGGGNFAQTGDGSQEKPFNLFEDALKEVAPNGTIVITNKAFINDNESKSLPFYINKPVTIKSAGDTPATLAVRSGGIVLGADVTFENISLSFENKVHDAIFANGHTLNLINVVRAGGSREVDLFAGSLYLEPGIPSLEPGSKSVVNVVTDSNFKGGTNSTSEFGNIYAGSMNGDFNEEAEIKVTNTGSSGILKVKGIFASGAFESDPSHMLDTQEPLPPEAMPDRFPMNGNVNITLNNYFPNVKGETGSTAKTSATTSTELPRTLNLDNVDHLTVSSGRTNLVNSNLDSLNKITVNQDAILSLVGVRDEFKVNTYSGNGTVILGETSSLHIEEEVTEGSSINLAVKEYFNDKSDPAIQNHTYLVTPEDATVTFKPSTSQPDLVVHPTKTGSELYWKVLNRKDISATPEPEEPSEFKILDFHIEEEEANQTVSVEDFSGNERPSIRYPFMIETNLADNEVDDIWLGDYEDLEVTVNGLDAVRTKDAGDYISYFVEDLNMYIYFEPDFEPGSQDLVVVFENGDKEPVTPEAKDYNIKVALDEATLETTLKVKGEEVPPTDPEGDEEETIDPPIVDPDGGGGEPPITDPIEPEVPKILNVVFTGGNERTYTYDFINFGITEPDNSIVKYMFQTEVEPTEESTLPEVKILDYKFNFTINGKEAVYREKHNDYYVESLGLAVNLEDRGKRSHELVVKGSDKDGNKVPIEANKYNIVAQEEKEDGVKLSVTLTVEGDQVEEPTTPNLPKIVGTGVTPGSDYKTLTYSTSNNEVKYPFKVYLDVPEGEPIPQVRLADYNFKYVVNGKEAVYREEHDDYYVESLGLSLHFNDLAPESHELVVKGSDKDGKEVPLKAGEYKIVTSTDVIAIDFYLTVTAPPSTGGSTGGGSSTPSTGGGGGSIPTTPPTDSGTSTTPPSTGGDSGATDTDLITPPPSTDKEEVTPKPPVVEDKVNGVENLKDLDKELQEKVDSIIADTLISENGLSLNLAGDKDDVSHVSTLEVTKDGVFANVDGEKVKFNTSLDLTDIDWDNSRVIRLNKSGDGYSAVPHKKLADGLQISSSDYGNLLIAPKVDEPFEDVADQDWFKSDVEEMYNYGFTTGTTATTFSPYEDITRAQFAVMLARAFELTPNNESKGLSDLKGKWYQDEAQALFEAGIIKGFANGTFGGEEKLTRQQAVTMIVNMLKYTGVKTEVADDIQFADLDKMGEHVQDAVKYLASQDVLVNGEGVKFNPYNNITRAQMAKVLVRSLHLTDLY